jgi:hypothetical protein
MMNWKGRERKRSWSNLRHYLRIYPEELRNITENLRIAGFRAEI